MIAGRPCVVVEDFEVNVNVEVAGALTMLADGQLEMPSVNFTVHEDEADEAGEAGEAGAAVVEDR